MGNLAKHYSTARLQGRLNGNEVSFSENKVFTEEDIEAAFNAGRDSVVENIPELEWREIVCRDKHFLEACALGAYYLIKLRDSEFHVAYNYRHFTSCTSLTAAKQAVKERCKELIKQALGLCQIRKRFMCMIKIINI